MLCIELDLISEQMIPLHSISAEPSIQRRAWWNRAISIKHTNECEKDIEDNRSQSTGLDIPEEIISSYPHSGKFDYHRPETVESCCLSISLIGPEGQEKLFHHQIHSLLPGMVMHDYISHKNIP